MERFKAQEQAESPRFSLLRAVRSRVAMAMIGLMSATACKASLDIDIRTPDSTRASAVDKDGLKVITVLEAGAVILLEKSEKNEKTRIEGFIHLSDSSPIHAPSQTIREYDMPEEARPWTRLVVEPSGRLILKAEGNQIALLFECKDLAAARITSCTGHEGKPKELDAEIAAEQQKYEEGRLDTGAPQPIPEAGTDASKTATPSAETGCVTDENNLDDKICASPEAKAKLDKLKPAISAMSWKDKQELARDLASAKPEWKQYVEKTIGEINHSPLGDLAKLNLDSTILHLLALQPDKIDLAAAALGVTF